MATEDAAASQAFRWHYGELDNTNLHLHSRGHVSLLIVFLLLLLLLVFLFLYLRSACRYHQLNGGQRTPVTPPPGLDPATIKSFPVLLHRKESSSPAEEAQCSICLSNLVEGEKVKVLPGCSHAFHPGCVDQWLIAQPSCPLCRASLDEPAAAATIATATATA